MTTTTDTRAPWPDVWQLYAEHRGVFARVLQQMKRKGWTIVHELEVDLVHEFLIRRAPTMLARYDHGRGTLEGLLAISFRNFVISELRTRRNAPELLVDKESLEGVAVNAEFERTLQDDDVRKALSRLPESDRKALDAFKHATSLRRAALKLGVSRWIARKRIADALKHLRAALRDST